MNLKALRIAKGLTQVQVAAAVGVSLTTYRMWEYGMPPTEENRKKLEEVLKNAEDHHLRRAQ
jgi:transcriptional regulator with XRE-family HTH domain